MMTVQPIVTMASTNSADENARTMSFDVNVMKIVSDGQNVTLEPTTSGKDIMIGYRTFNHTAELNSDFTVPDGPLTISAGQPGGSIDVTLVTNDLKEDDESFTLVLSDPINTSFGGIVGSRVASYQYLTSEATITDVDGPLPILSFTTTRFQC